jgi:hypothetical protein
MGRDTLFLDQPVQHRSGPVSGIADNPLRLKTEALLCSLDHGLCRADLGLPNGAGGLDVNDDAELQVDEIVVGISEECRSLISAGPLGRGIGRRNELRNNVAGAPHAVSSRVARYSFTARLDLAGITIPAPILIRDRALLVGVGLDQARIDCKAFATNQTGRNAGLDDTFKHAAKNIPLAKTLVPGTRECRMIRDSGLDAEPAEPAIGEVLLLTDGKPVALLLLECGRVGLITGDPHVQQLAAAHPVRRRAAPVVPMAVHAEGFDGLWSSGLPSALRSEATTVRGMSPRKQVTSGPAPRTRVRPRQLQRRRVDPVRTHENLSSGSFIEPFAWLKDVLERMANGHPPAADELLLWN